MYRRGPPGPEALMCHAAALPREGLTGGASRGAACRAGRAALLVGPDGGLGGGERLRGDDVVGEAARAHSITRSERRRSDCGIARPMPFADLRLMMSSSVEGRT